ncbi:Uu.00g135850.m01.CDS01 [Anthostomella pinea]|uniref:U3 small nucleolar RNA-associated protein 22 n=1 Tax=Anthostomella pinea TaxID=933095 RepID=A0AAI8VIS4_9PEZI|nr:Uu.00g135850.m01.CDS01 [Anthostomella pinea]
MEANTAKRRKLGHSNGGLTLGSASSSSMGASGSSAYILETDELLEEAKISDYNKAFPGLSETLRQFKDVIESLDDHEPLPISDVSASFEKTNRVAIPYPDPKPRKDSPYKLAFAKPTQVNVVGSYAFQTMIRTQAAPSVDMIVVMPASLFQEKDYRDYRYFYKRAYYLAYISAGLRRKFGTMDFSYSNLGGNVLLPILSVCPKNKSSKQDSADCAVRIIPNAPEGCFPTAKLSATSNAVRHTNPQDTGDSKDTKMPTPFYNATLKAESLFTSFLRLLHNSQKTCPAFQDACILGRIWLQQRGFGADSATGGFGHFHWAVLMALLLQTGGRKGEPTLSPSLHATQLFKATLQFLASANLHKKAVVLGQPTPEPEAIRQPLPVLYDSSRGINILSNMTLWSASLLTEQAKWSLSAINGNPRDQFDPLFIVKVNQPLQMFDLLLRVKIPVSRKDTRLDDCRGFLWSFCDTLYRTLKKALGERAQLIHIEVPKTTSWPVTATSSRAKTESLQVGIIVDPAKASQARDFGPPYEQKKEAAKYQEFWGEKAELWQFPDGNIVESLDWTQFAPFGFSGICEALVRYILKLRLELSDSDIEFYGQDPSRIISLSPTDKTAFDKARKAFAMFEKDVRDLNDLPLQVKQIAPIAPELRYASVRIPDVDMRRRVSRPIDAIVSFEMSGKWPENIAAIQRMKVAMLLKIGSSFEESNDAVKTHLGLENVDRNTQNLAFLDIVYDTGFCFRLRVHSDLEETLLDRQAKDKTLERHDRTDAADLVTSLKQTYTNLPLQNQTISTFCTRFPELSSSIRLTKRWFSSHRLSNHFDEALIEWFVLQAFLHPYPWTTPSSAVMGFLRTLLLLARWDWRDEPLIIDPQEALSSSQRIGITTRLDAWRKIDPNMNRTTLFVATSHDVTGIAYTQGISKVVATRMTSLARAACKAVKEKDLELDIKSLFLSPLRDYDVVIHLAPKVIKSVQQDDGTKQSLFKNLSGQGRKEAPPLLEEPVELLLKRLNAIYPSPLLFFNGGAEDNIIAALWNPQLHSRTFTVNMPCSFKPVDQDGDMFELNRDAVLAEIARVGGDLVEKIDVKGGD